MCHLKLTLIIAKYTVNPAIHVGLRVTKTMSVISLYTIVILSLIRETFSLINVKFVRSPQTIVLYKENGVPGTVRG